MAVNFGFDLDNLEISTINYIAIDVFELLHITSNCSM